MELVADKLQELEPLTAKNGANGIHFIDKQKKVVLKCFKSLFQIEDREKMIDHLLLFQPIPKSGYPIDSLRVDGEFDGYVSPFFEDSVPFNRKNNYTFTQKIQACRDVSFQLQKLHQRGIIFHDMNSGNQLINADGGHLVDFEDVWIPGHRYPPRVRYFLYYQQNYLPSNMKQDQLKQYISNLGLLYQMDLESYFYQRGSLEQLPDLFEVNPTLKEFLQTNIAQVENQNVDILDYFDAIIPSLEDEEKHEWEEAKLHEHNIVQTLSLKK